MDSALPRGVLLQKLMRLGDRSQPGERQSFHMLKPEYGFVNRRISLMGESFQSGNPCFGNV
jgi:hypothetical protein